jgi:hypothetical protein
METSLWAWLSIRTKMFSIAIGFSLATLFLYYILWFDFDTGDDPRMIIFADIIDTHLNPMGSLLGLCSCCLFPFLLVLPFVILKESLEELKPIEVREIQGHDLVFIERLEIDSEAIPFDDYLYESIGDSRVLQVSEKLLEKLLAAKERWYIGTDKKEGITYLFEGKKGELLHADESGNLIVDPPEICSILRSFMYLAEIYNPENKDSYTILSVRSGSFAENRLAELVNEHISEGWRTVGGQSTSGGVNSYQMITQAMERDIPEKVVVPESIISRCEDIQAKVDDKPESDN